MKTRWVQAVTTGVLLTSSSMVAGGEPCGQGEARAAAQAAQQYIKQEKFDAALQELERATQLRPQAGRYWHDKGLTLIRLAERDRTASRWREAYVAFSRCIEVDPNRSACHHERGNVEVYLDHEQRALIDYTRAITLRPDVGWYYPPIADLYMRLDRLSKAEAVLREGLTLVRPDDRNVFYLWEMLAACLLLRQDRVGTVSALEHAVAVRGGKHPEVLFNLGSTYVIIGKKTEGVSMLKSFMAEACKGPKATNLREQCELSLALISKVGGGQ